jgi:hypothetical protein
MTLRDEIESAFQRIVLEVHIAGRPVGGIIGADVSMGLRQINAQAAIHLLSRPTAADEGVSCEIWAGYNGRTQQIFKGELSGLAWEYFPGVITLDARDKLGRTRLAWGAEDRTYAGQDDAAIIQNLVEAMGIPSSETHIESSGWTLGTVQEVVAAQGRAFWPLIEEIDKLAGYRTFTRADGVIYRTRVSSAAGASAAFSYAKGVNIIDIRRRRDREGIVNRVVVTGLEYEGLSVGGEGIGEAYADNPYIPSPPRYVSETVQSDLVEDDATALAIATRMVADKNRRPESYEVTVIGNPLLIPQMTVALTHPDVESGAATVLIDHVAHTIRGSSFRTTFQTLGGAISGTSAGMPPLPQFDVKLFQEAEDTGSGIEGRLVVICDASASIDPDGDERLLDFAWTIAADAGTPMPASGAGAVFRSVISGGPPTELTITLVATDPTALAATLVRTVVVDSSTLLLEDLYTAEGTIVACSSDGEQTWREATVPGGALATCLMPIAPAWGELWGTDSGHVYATFDKLTSDLVDLGIPHGAVACTAVWVHEVDATRAWAAFADGAVYAGVIDVAGFAATWTAAGTIPDGPVEDIRESYGALGSLRATSGAGYYASEDGGASWTLIDSGDTAWRMAGGWDTNLYSFLNDSDPLRAESGSAPTVPVLSPLVEHIRGLAFGWRQKELYASDDQARLFLSDAALTALTLQTDAAGAIVNHMIRSGNADRVVYMAIGDGTGSDNGFEKWIPGTAAPWYIRRTGSRKGYMIGYGPAHLVAARVGFVFAPFAETDPDKDQWHRYDNGVYTHGPLPQSDWKWTSLKVNPEDTAEWLLLGFPPSITVENDDRGQIDMASGVARIGSDSVLYRSTDAGASWTAIDLPIWDMTDGARYTQIYGCAWQAGGRWVVNGREDVPVSRWSLVWFGTGTSATCQPFSDWSDLFWVGEGMGGDTLFGQADAFGGGTSGGVASLHNGASLLQVGPFFIDVPITGSLGFAQPGGPLDTVPLTPQIYVASVQNGHAQGIAYSSNYDYWTNPLNLGASRSVANLIDGGWVWVACSNTDVFAVGERTSGVSGIWRCPSGGDVAGHLAGAPDYPCHAAHMIRVGRVRRQVAVAYAEPTAGAYQFVGYDGDVWQAIPMPYSGMHTLTKHFDLPYDVIES